MEFMFILDRPVVPPQRERKSLFLLTGTTLRIRRRQRPTGKDCNDGYSRHPQADARSSAVQNAHDMVQRSPSTTLMARGLEQGDSCEPLDPLPSNTSVLCEGLSGLRRSIEWLDDNTDCRPRWTHRRQGVRPLQWRPWHVARIHCTERGKQAARAYAFVDT